MSVHIRRRHALTLIAGVMIARSGGAQQPKLPTVGVLFGGSAGLFSKAGLPALLSGMGEFGYRNGDNVAVEVRAAEGRYERLPAMAAELVDRKVDVIVALASPASLAAKAATSTIPIVVGIGADPIALGLVKGLGQPGGNITGATFLAIEFTGKQLQLLHDLVPKARTVGFLVNSQAPDASAQTSRAEAAARTFGLTLQVVNAHTASDFEPALNALAERHADGLLVSGDEFFTSEAGRLVGLAARHEIPAVYALRLFPLAGGLASYGASLPETIHQTGLYTGRVLKGTKPADLPVVQTTKFELVINLKTAKELGLTVPSVISAGADEVIE